MQRLRHRKDDTWMSALADHIGNVLVLIEHSGKFQQQTDKQYGRPRI